MNFEDLKADIEASYAKRVESIKAGVAIDVAIRLVVFTAAKSLSSAEFAMVRAAIENSGIETQWSEDFGERAIAKQGIVDVLDGVERSQKAFPK